jgi:signal transduction histidine kinase
MNPARGRWMWVVAPLIVAWGLWTATESSDAYDFLLPGGTGWSFLAAGFLAWSIRPKNRIGPLLVLVGVQFVLVSLEAYSRVPLLWTLGAAIASPPPIITYAVLAFPSGRLESWPARLLVAASLIHQPILQGFIAGRFYDPRDWGCTDCPPGLNLFLIRSDPELVVAINGDFGLRFGAGISLLVALVLVQRYRTASPPMRRVVQPVYAISMVLFPASVGYFIASFSGFEAWAWVQQYIVGPSLLVAPAAFVAGLLRLRSRRSKVGELVVRLGETRDPSVLSAALRETLVDPTADVGFWDPDASQYLSAEGVPLSVPEGLVFTDLDGEGGPIARLVHDPALAEEPELLEAAAAAARLSVDNARLTDRISAQLEEVGRSRARIVEAADDARKQIERDLHDGAQQRLVGLLMSLRSGEALAKTRADGELTGILSKASGDLERALHELRELAKGLHPPILAQEGLAASLEELIEVSPVPVHLEVVEGRFPPPVETASYFTVAEALANVGKHSQASKATVRVGRENGRLRIEVEDDGVGGADPSKGSGLRGLSDRVEAAAGTLTVLEVPDGGTKIVAEIPCA